MLKNLQMSALIALSLFVLSCSLTPPDVPLCREKSMSSAHCTYIVSAKTIEVNHEKKLFGKTWWESRPYMIQMPIDSWVELKKFIIKVCKKYKCDGPDISSWKRSIKTIDSELVEGK